MTRRVQAAPQPPLRAPGRDLRAVAAMALVLAALACAAPAARADAQAELAARLTARVEDAPPVGVRSATWAAVRDLVVRRAGRLAWCSDAQPLDVASALIEALRRTADHGLDPDELEVERLASAVASARSHGEIVDLEVALDVAAIRAMEQLLQGRVAPHDIARSWRAAARRRDLAAELDAAVERGDPWSAFAAVLPSHDGYHELVPHVARLRELAAAGDWPHVPDGDVIEPGEEADSQRLLALRARLVGAGCLDERVPCPAPGKYDATLVAAVERFQRLHGLAADGVVGPLTQQALDVTAAERAEQVAWNLDRWRWLPDRLGDRHVRVGVPAFEASLHDGGSAVLSMRVIVGREGWGTPVFSDAIETVVVNPYWNIPARIAAREVWPQARRNPAAMAAKGYELVDAGGRAVPLTAVTRPQAAGYSIRQRPGAGNALGRIKLLFPNPHSVYMHDTPAHALFERDDRALSHGCIRVERPIELAVAVMEGRTHEPWDAGRVQAAIDAGATVDIAVDPPVPVHVLYFTAAVDEDGSLRFFPDVYGHDARHEAALRRRPES